MSLWRFFRGEKRASAEAIHAVADADKRLALAVERKKVSAATKITLQQIRADNHFTNAIFPVRKS